MNTGELNRLEREVEEARNRLTADLDRLRAPDTLSSFKSDLVKEARDAKDEWIGKTKDAARDGAQRLFEEVKNRAAANPIATAAIGAGLLWHLARHPPITSLLVGAGLFSLIRTNSQQPSVAVDMISQAGEVARSVREKVSDWSSSATEAAGRTAEFAGSARERIGEWTTQPRDAAREAISKVASTTDNLTGRVTQAVGEVIHDDRSRDGLLLGVATLAIAAAVGVAYQRRASE
jgi:uncharacterized protein YjbJ (UPF0337 family)